MNTTKTMRDLWNAVDKLLDAVSYHRQGEADKEFDSLRESNKALTAANMALLEEEGKTYRGDASGIYRLFVDGVARGTYVGSKLILQALDNEVSSFIAKYRKMQADGTNGGFYVELINDKRGPGGKDRKGVMVGDNEIYFVEL